MQFLENEVHEYSKMVWSTLLGFEIEPKPGVFGFSPDTITGSIQINGNWNGIISIYLPSSLANLITETMFSLNSGEASAETKKDAVGEVINMIGGNIKSILPQPSYLSIPIFSMEGQSQEFPFTKEVTHCQFAYNGNPFALSIYEQKTKDTKKDWGKN